MPGLRRPLAAVRCSPVVGDKSMTQRKPNLFLIGAIAEVAKPHLITFLSSMAGL
jgi:hypothetical protein